MARLARRATAGLIALAVALLLGLNHTGVLAAEQGFTYQGALAGGTVRITLSNNQLAVSRAELNGAVFYPNYPNGVTVTQTMYYYPSVAFVGGEFGVMVPINLVGSRHGSIRLRGADDNNGGLTGDATYCVDGSCYDQLTLPWSATATAAPPAASDVRFAGPLEIGGSITIARNAQNQITSFDIDALPRDTCFPGAIPLTLHTFFEPAGPASGPGVILQTPIAGWQALSITIDAPDLQSLTGTLLLRGFYLGDGAIESSWSASEQGQGVAVGGVARLASLGAQPAAARAHAGRAWPFWPVLVALAAVAIAGATVAIRRR